MKYGSLICVGKENPDWDYSAPYGAGRSHSRADAKRIITVEEYEQTMAEAGILSTSVNAATLDECPTSYKGISDIVDTAEIISRLKSLYNFDMNLIETAFPIGMNNNAKKHQNIKYGWVKIQPSILQERKYYYG